jgi:hypothetical protein
MGEPKRQVWPVDSQHYPPLRTILHGPPMTLGNAATAQARLIVWCKACGHRGEPDPT